MINKVKEHIQTLFIDRNTAVYFYSSGTEYISQEVLNKIKDKSMYHNILRIQYNYSIICGSYCIVSIEYMIAGKTLVDYTYFFLLTTIKRMTNMTIYNYF